MEHPGELWNSARDGESDSQHIHISDWFKIKSGVKQGCVISGFLLLLAMNWIMRKTTADKRRGIQWNLTTVFEDLDFADDITLLSSKFKFARNRESILMNSEEEEDVKESAYL